MAVSKKWFWSRVRKTKTCWIWTGFKLKNGYGYPTVDGKNWRAHRLSWVLSGRELIPGLELSHTCENRSCVRPSHLRQVTHKENMLYGKGRIATLARRKKCRYGHLFTEENTFVQILHGKTVRRCRKCYRRNQQIRYRKFREILSKRNPAPLCNGIAVFLGNKPCGQAGSFKTSTTGEKVWCANHVPQYSITIRLCYLGFRGLVKNGRGVRT